MRIIKKFGRCIKTKYLGATNHKPSRVKAIDGNRSVTISYDDELSTQDSHFEAVKRLCEKHEYEWGNEWGVTSMESSDGYLFFSLRG